MAGITSRLGKYYKSVHFMYGQAVIHQSAVYHVYTLSVEMPCSWEASISGVEAAAIFSGVLRHYAGEHRVMPFPSSLRR